MFAYKRRIGESILDNFLRFFTVIDEYFITPPAKVNNFKIIILGIGTFDPNQYFDNIKTHFANNDIVPSKMSTKIQ